MTPYSQAWEQTLLSQALEAENMMAPRMPLPVSNRVLLIQAYEYCDQVTSAHSRTFYLATRFLSPEKRRALRALYAFCRQCDNIVDVPSHNARTALATWRQKALSGLPFQDNLTIVAWADIQHRYRIPLGYAEQLIDGVTGDLSQQRYKTFADLATYAYQVASTVGLMSMHIIGYSDERAIPYAIKLGIALQLTNILRDIAEDRRAQRIYLPTDELAAYDLTEADLDGGKVDNRWRAFMRFQIQRNRCLYAEATPGIALLNRDGRFAVATASTLYRAILDDIEAHNYDVFQRRAHVKTWDKLSIASRTWQHLLMRGTYETL
jgi:phytoene synthase